MLKIKLFLQIFVKEIWKFNGNIDKFLTKSTVKVAKKKNKMKKYYFIIYIFI